MDNKQTDEFTVEDLEKEVRRWKRNKPQNESIFLVLTNPNLYSHCVGCSIES